MKDLFNHQKSMVFGVKKIQRRHCRAFLKDQIPNHILMCMTVIVFAAVHRMQGPNQTKTTIPNPKFIAIYTPNTTLMT